MKTLNLFTSKKAASRRIIGVLITVVVIALLLLSGPATAFDLQLDTPSDITPTQGDTITFTASAEVLANELVPIANLSLDFSDGTKCYFTVGGDIITGCTGITITQSNDSTNHTSGVFNFTAAGIIHDDYGAGFGYGFAEPGPSRLVYDVTLDTGEFERGTLTYTLNAHIEDATFTSDEQSITIERSSSGGGGGGGSIALNPSNTLNWSQITPGAATITKITNEALGLTQIIIEVNNPAKNITIRIEKLAGKPAAVNKTITGKVYSYLQITKQNLDDSNLKGNAKLQFKVPMSWFLNNKVEVKNIALKRFNNGAWQDLKTTLLSTDSRYAYFESETPGFSYFAIGEKGAELTPVPKAEELVTAGTEGTGATGEVVKEEAAQPETKPVVQPEKRPATTTTETKAKTSTGAQVLIVVVIVVAIGLILLETTRKRKALRPLRQLKG